MGFGKKRSSKVGVGAITTDKNKLFAEGGMLDDGKDVDPVSGNDVPVGSLAEEVRDDVDAKLSPGEFVFPADVVRFIGLERLMQMRDQAKKGLMRMNDIGQMGNADEAGEKADDTYEEDDDFESKIDELMKDVDSEEENSPERQTEMAFNTGGFVNPSYYDLTKAPKNPALDIRYFNDSEGKTFYMPFINGKPMKPMPNGAVPTGMPTSSVGTGRTTPTTPASSSDLKNFGKGTAVTGITTATGSVTPNLDAQGKTGTATTDPTKAGAGSSVSVAGTYTGSNLSDFGRSDMIYNPGGSGKSGEIVTEDLYSGITRAETQLGNAAVAALAAAAGVPGILTQGIRWAIKTYGQNAVNEFMGQLNREIVGRAGGVDPSTPDGFASAASQIDQIRDRGDSTAAASSGATGTGGRAADVGQYVFDQLKDTGLTDAEIASAAQKAVDSVIRGKSLNDAVTDAVRDAKPDFGVRLSDADAAPTNEGDLYGGNDSFGVLLSDMDTLSKDIGFDWGSMGEIEPQTSSPLTTPPEWMQYRRGDEKFFTDIPDAFTLEGAGRLLERFETDEQRQN